MSAPKILAFAGSTRRDSFNRRLLALAVEIAGQHGVDVRHIELRDYPMPIMDEDLEAEHGQPEHATEVRRMMLESDALLLASPEYNSSVTPLMKNVIDWCSRKEEGGGDLEAYKGRKALVIGASPGRFGAKRSVEALSAILGNIGVDVFEDSFTLAKAAEAFDDDDRLSDDEQARQLASLVERFAASVKDAG